MTKARDLSKLLSTANGKIAGANLDVSFENISDTGTAGTKVASGTTLQRGSTAGQIRFNTTTGLAEYYTGTEFKIIDTPPIVTAVSPLEVDSTVGGNITFTITGSNFQSGAVVKFIGNDATELTASTTTINSSSSISAIIARSSFTNAKEPYDVRVLNTSGLSGTLDNQISVDTSPTWSTASGSLGSFNNYDTVNVSVTATDVDGDTITYSIFSGSLPTGLSLSSSTGAITGTPTGATSVTTSSFTLRATANSKTADRAFTITVSPVVQVFTYTGSSQAFTVPAGVTSFSAYVWGAGGAGGSSFGGSGGGLGGAGGYVSALISNYSPNQTFGILVGQSNESDNTTTIRSFGGGGNGGGQVTQRIGGAGGGRSEINIGTVGNTPNGTRILVAGGGGGGNARYSPENESIANGGVGGNPSGGNGSGSGTVPTGGSQSAGGNAGSGLKDSGANPTTAGTAGIGGMATGGDTAVDTNYGAGGGGGGGYYGGGGGDGGLQYTTAQSGAGGSSYANPSYTSSITFTSGSGQTAPQTGNTYYASGIAQGGNGINISGSSGTAGGNGRIVITY